MAALASPSLPALGEADWARLAAGESVVRSRPVEGYPWPEVVVHRLVGATPAEVMALWADFERQPAWVPTLVATRVVHRAGPAQAHVFYEYEVAGPNERYTVVVDLAREEGGFAARWDLVSARYARRLAGHLRAIPHPRGALIEYASRVDPGTLGVAFGSPESVARRLQETARALGAEVERLRAAEPEVMASLVRRLGAMLDGRAG